jgi:hypothetical protein
MFYSSQLEISLHIITAESNFGVGSGEAISFAENIAFLLVFDLIPSIFLNQFT